MMKTLELTEEYANSLISQKIVFGQWKLDYFLSSIFELNKRLNVQYDNFYQELFEIKLFALITELFDYIKHNNAQDNHIIKILQKYIPQLVEAIDIDMMFYLEYRRHTYCHLQQSNFEIIRTDKNGNLQPQNINPIQESGNGFSKYQIDRVKWSQVDIEIKIPYSNNFQEKGKGLHNKVSSILDRLQSEINQEYNRNHNGL